MDELKPCPFCNGTHSINVINFFTRDSFRKCDICGAEAPEAKTPEEAAEKWNTRPTEDAKDREIERLNNELGIQKNLTRQACFEANRAYDEVDKLKKMFYDLFVKQASISTDPKVIVVGTDTNVPTKESEVKDE